MSNSKAKEVLDGIFSKKDFVGGRIQFDTDYMFGRMMKTTFIIYEAGRIQLQYSQSPEYTSWLHSGISAQAREKQIITEALIEVCIKRDDIDEKILEKVVSQA